MSNKDKDNEVIDTLLSMLTPEQYKLLRLKIMKEIKEPGKPLAFTDDLTKPVYHKEETSAGLTDDLANPVFHNGEPPPQSRKGVSKYSGFDDMEVGQFVILRNLKAALGLAAYFRRKGWTCSIKQQYPGTDVKFWRKS
jgi:hypothetical protein